MDIGRVSASVKIVCSVAGDRGLPILLLPVVLSNNYAAVVVVGNPSSSN